MFNVLFYDFLCWLLYILGWCLVIVHLSVTWLTIASDKNSSAWMFLISATFMSLDDSVTHGKSFSITKETQELKYENYLNFQMTPKMFLDIVGSLQHQNQVFWWYISSSCSCKILLLCTFVTLVTFTTHFEVQVPNIQKSLGKKNCPIPTFTLTLSHGYFKSKKQNMPISHHGNQPPWPLPLSLSEIMPISHQILKLLSKNFCIICNF